MEAEKIRGGGGGGGAPIIYKFNAEGQDLFVTITQTEPLDV